MSKASPESIRKTAAVTCNLCRMRKEIDALGGLCHSCERYTAWRKKWFPDDRTTRRLVEESIVTREERIWRYSLRASMHLPLFEKDGKESAA